MIPQFEPVFDTGDGMMVYHAVMSGYLNERTFTGELESAFARYVGARYAIATTSGTAAIFLALKAAGVKYGDKVAVPDLTMIGTVNAVRLAGGVPVFIDVSTQDGNMSLMRLAEHNDIAGVVVVHLNGRAADLSGLLPLAKSRGWFVVEDAAQCLGSRFGNAGHLGTFGDVGCFSLATSKIITSGGGGMVVTNKKETFLKLRALKDQGRYDRRPDGSLPGEERYEYEGYNFRFDEMKAALGLSQFQKLEARVAHKRRICSLYSEAIGDSVDYLRNPIGTLLWYFDIVSLQRNAIARALTMAGIGWRQFYPPLHRQPVYRTKGRFPVTDSLSDRGIYLPSSSNLKDEQVLSIAETVRKATR